MNFSKIQGLYFDLFEKLKHFVIKKNVNNMLDSYTNPDFSLTKEQKKQIEELYSAYTKVSTVSHRFYTQKTGVFSPKYIPMDIYLNVIDEYYNNRNDSKVMDNKCYYYTLFKGIPQPDPVIFRISGLWFSSNMQLINFDCAKKLLCDHDELFVKQATASCGGKGVVHISKSKGDIVLQFEQFLEQAKGDIVVQQSIKQHSKLAAINQSSVNTIRIISMLSESGVKIYSSILRVGVGNKKIDNASSGGVTSGITADGKLKSPIYKLNGEKFDFHPTNGFDFNGYEVPCFEEAKKLVEKAHPMVPHFKLVSWDIAIDENGIAVLVEANLAKGSSEFHQLNNGPLFGDDTNKILDEVFGKKI